MPSLPSTWPRALFFARLAIRWPPPGRRWPLGPRGRATRRASCLRRGLHGRPFFLYDRFDLLRSVTIFASSAPSSRWSFCAFARRRRSVVYILFAAMLFSFAAPHPPGALWGRITMLRLGKAGVRCRAAGNSVVGQAHSVDMRAWALSGHLAAPEHSRPGRNRVP